MTPVHSRHASRPRPLSSGFTLIELLVVVAIIIALIGILVPSLTKFYAQTTRAAARAQLETLRMGLEHYWKDHNVYPLSKSPLIPARTNVYGPPGDGRGDAMLAQALVGYLGDGVAAQPGSGDGADGPGFRLRRDTGMGAGTVYGPYVSPDSKHFRPTPSLPTTATPPLVSSFIDPWGNPILYYRSLVTTPPTAPIYVFKTSGPQVGFFDPTDCQWVLKWQDPTGGDPKANPVNPGNPSASNDELPLFFKLFKLTSNEITPAYTGGKIPGSDSYLIISAGADGKYFSRDDLIMTKDGLVE